jgi:ABC-type transport system substrate-binding protein
MPTRVSSLKRRSGARGSRPPLDPDSYNGRMPPRVFSRRWRRRTWCAAAAVLVAVAGAVAEAGAAGELRIGLPRVPDTVDPLAVTAGPGLVVLRQLFQGLVEVGERGDLVPGLATA